MKRIIIFVLLCASWACSDQKMDVEQCAVEHRGDIRIQNFNSDKYEINIVGVVIVTVDGKSINDLLMIPEGTYRVEFVNMTTGGGGFIEDFEVKSCVYNLLPILF